MNDGMGLNGEVKICFFGCLRGGMCGERGGKVGGGNRGGVIKGDKKREFFKRGV